jgi:hypothetical protein
MNVGVNARCYPSHVWTEENYDKLQFSTLPSRAEDQISELKNAKQIR